MNTTNEQTNKVRTLHVVAGHTRWFAHVLVPVLLCFLVLAPTLSYAETPHALMVTLRDVRGGGIADATITVRDEVGRMDLAHTTTDTQGIATLPNVMADVVRVAVSGTLADGTPLSQHGQDARGIWLLLDAPLVQLDLRSERNGDILPDPTTMIAGDAPISTMPGVATVVPTSAALLPPAIVSSVPTAIPFAAPPPNVTTIRPWRIGQGMVIIGTLMLLLVGWFLLTRRASR